MPKSKNDKKDFTQLADEGDIYSITDLTILKNRIIDNLNKLDEAKQQHRILHIGHLSNEKQKTRKALQETINTIHKNLSLLQQHVETATKQKTNDSKKIDLISECKTELSSVVEAIEEHNTKLNDKKPAVKQESTIETTPTNPTPKTKDDKKNFTQAPGKDDKYSESDLKILHDLITTELKNLDTNIRKIHAPHGGTLQQKQATRTTLLNEYMTIITTLEHYKTHLDTAKQNTNDDTKIAIISKCNDKLSPLTEQFNKASKNSGESNTTTHDQTSPKTKTPQHTEKATLKAINKKRTPTTTTPKQTKTQEQPKTLSWNTKGQQMAQEVKEVKKVTEPTEEIKKSISPQELQSCIEKHYKATGKLDTYTTGPELQALQKLVNSKKEYITFSEVENAIKNAESNKDSFTFGKAKEHRADLLTNPTAHPEDKTGVSNVIRAIGKFFEEKIQANKEADNTTTHDTSRSLKM